MCTAKIMKLLRFTTSAMRKNTVKIISLIRNYKYLWYVDARNTHVIITNVHLLAYLLTELSPS
jgi:hypothetical protein